MNYEKESQKKLEELLSKVQKEIQTEEFIYGVTSRISRNWRQRIGDFFIDRSRVPSREKAYFFELLATMIRAGIPLNRALKILVARTMNARLKRVISTLSYELEHGRSFSQALDRFPEIFAETERGVIRSAEAVGHLEQMLFKIADNMDRRNDLMMRLKGALIYPIAVLAALVIGVVVMLVFVVPRIKEIFAQSSLELPITTRILLNGSEFLANFWWLIVLLILFGVIVFHVYTHTEEGRFSWDFRKLRIPLIGPMLRKIFVLRFTDTLGLLVESGLPINEALEYTAAAIGNEVYRVKTYEALGLVQEGKKLSQALAAAPFLFPETVTNMIAVGEHAATLGELSQKIGSHYHKEIDFTLKNMTTVLGPILILVIGITVAFFALSVLSPIFSLTQAVS